MRVSRQHAGSALLIVALLLAAVAATLRFFVVTSEQSAGADTVGSADHNTAEAGLGSPGSRTSGQPAPGTSGRTPAGAGAVGSAAVTVTGAAALPSAHVHAGYGTPTDAVDGFYQALLGGTPARACAYVTTPCPSFGPRAITGRVSVINAVSHAGKALVEITGTICVGKSCVPLTDRVMMPTGPASLSGAWTSLTSGVYGWAASPLPCVQDPATGQWRVKLG